MAGCYREKSWLQVKLTSRSSLDVRLSIVDLIMNPELASFLTLSNKVNDIAAGVVLKSGEAFECLFELDVKEKPAEFSVSSESLSEAAEA